MATELTRTPLTERGLDTRNVMKTESRKQTGVLLEVGGERSHSCPNLQESFLRFKKNRQEDLRQAKRMKQKQLAGMADPQQMSALRMKFVDTIKKYFGVPYAKKYWAPQEPHYSSPLFMDCCGLVRRALRDMQVDLGFRVGQWNQAYQFDTLPITVVTEEEMKPGDLVFIAATYFNPKSKAQRHDMVHVEVWLGNGPKTIGARWQRGVVQIFDHYKFEAKSYHSPTYIFKSIDTWLTGICQSYCSVHPWQKSKFEPGQRSVFALSDNQEDEEDEGAGDTDDEMIRSFGDERDLRNMIDSALHSDNSQNHVTLQENISENVLPDQPNIVPTDRELSAKVMPDQSVQSPDSITLSVERLRLECNDGESRFGSNKENVTQHRARATVGRPALGNRQTACDGDDINDNEPSNSSTEQTSGANNGKTRTGTPGGRSKPKTNGSRGSPSEGDDDGNNGSRRRRVCRPPRTTLAANQTPAFFIGGGNGVSLVEEPLLRLGWKRITDKHNDNYKLKWTECKSSINFLGFNEGDQMVNHIPNCQLLTNKMGLLNSLRAYDRVNGVAARPRGPAKLSLEDYLPVTYILDDSKERDTFYSSFKDGDIWICKPCGMNQGKGIYLVRSLDEFKKTMEERDEKRSQRRPSRPSMNRIVQRYIRNPLLLENRKFDIRAYMLIGSTVPLMVYYHKGYVRLCCNEYDNDSQDLARHLTNQYVQKKDPAYQEVKDNTTWSMEKFNDYINQHFEDSDVIEHDWVKVNLTRQMQRIMIHCFNAVKHKLHSKVGYFELFGFDFMIDTDFLVWLIEINTNPALHINCEALKEVIPGVVQESLYIAIECFEKASRNKTLSGLTAPKNFTMLYNGDSGRYANLGGVRLRPRCQSPSKEASPVASNAEVTVTVTTEEPQNEPSPRHNASQSSTALEKSTGLTSATMLQSYSKSLSPGYSPRPTPRPRSNSPDKLMRTKSPRTPSLRPTLEPSICTGVIMGADQLKLKYTKAEGPRRETDSRGS